MFASHNSSELFTLSLLIWAATIPCNQVIFFSSPILTFNEFKTNAKQLRFNEKCMIFGSNRFFLSMLLILVRFINVNKLGAVVALLIINCLKTIIELNEILNVVFFSIFSKVLQNTANFGVMHRIVIVRTTC